MAWIIPIIAGMHIMQKNREDVERRWQEELRRREQEPPSPSPPPTYFWDMDEGWRDVYYCLCCRHCTFSSFSGEPEFYCFMNMCNHYEMFKKEFDHDLLNPVNYELMEELRKEMEERDG